MLFMKTLFYLKQKVIKNAILLLQLQHQSMFELTVFSNETQQLRLIF